MVPLNFDRLRYEADFRYGLMRFRDNVELVTLSRVEDLERRGALTRFASIMRNWWQLIAAQRNLTLFTGQQRLAIARVLLNEPDWLFLDKATSSVDAETEKRIYELLAARLPRATVISVTQSPTVAAYHARRWTIEAKQNGPSSLRAA